MKITFTPDAWEEYLWWQAQDRKVLKRIDLLIADIMRNGNDGIGKPEPLRGELQGLWSRRITDEHRLVYELHDESVELAACRYHLANVALVTEGRPIGHAFPCTRSGVPFDQETDPHTATSVHPDE